MNPTTRRDFLRSSAVGAGGALLSGAAHGRPIPMQRQDPYEQLELGRSGVRVTRLGLGTGMRGWKRQSNQTRLGQAKFTALVRHALDRGVRLFDLADLYGSHPFFAHAMAGVPRDRYTILTKIWFNRRGLPNDDRPDADRCIERFCRELKTDYLDIVLLHCQQEADWPQRMARQMRIMESLKQKGIIRAHGVSIHDFEALKTAADEPWVDSINARINAFGQSMDEAPDKVVPVLRRAIDLGKGVVGMKLCDEGRFRDEPARRDRSIDVALNEARISAMVVGCEAPDELDDFAARIARTPRRPIP